MNATVHRGVGAIGVISVLLTGQACSTGERNVTAFIGARVFDGTGAAPVDDMVMLVRDGRFERVGPRSAVTVPVGAREVDLAGKFVIPGLINTHGHVGDTRGLEAGQYSDENVLRQLQLYARYGVTTVNSLGGDEAAAVALRNSASSPSKSSGDRS